MKTKMPEWKRRMIDKLSKRRRLDTAVRVGRERIAILNEKMTSVRTSRADAVPTSGGSSRYEDRLLDCITEIKDIETVLNYDKAEMHCLDKALGTLGAEERLLLDLWLFGGGVKRCREQLGYGETVIYAKLDTALRKVATAFCEI